MKRSGPFIFTLLLTVLFCTACGGNGSKSASATTMRLERTEGSVSVSDDQGENVKLQEHLPLYSGYLTETVSASYAWINLDDVKLAKLDEDSRASVRKENKHLELTADQGSLFFHVTEPLEEDETMEIRTGTMVVGIRGTCGWVDSRSINSSSVYILEGTVTCELPDGCESVQISGGEMARVISDENGNMHLETKRFFREDIPPYVQAELDDALLTAVPETLPEEETSSEAPAETEAAEDGVHTMPVSSEELTDILRQANDKIITIQAGTGDNTLIIDDFSFIHENATLLLEEGVSLSIADGGTINVYGKMEVKSDITNDGFILITENGELRVDGQFVNTGLISNGESDKDTGDGTTQNSHIVAAQGIESTGGIINMGTIEGTITQTENGALTLVGGTVEHIVLNGGQLINAGGAYGELTQNGGTIR